MESYCRRSQEYGVETYFTAQISLWTTASHNSHDLTTYNSRSSAIYPDMVHYFQHSNLFTHNTVRKQSVKVLHCSDKKIYLKNVENVPYCAVSVECLYVTWDSSLSLLELETVSQPYLCNWLNHGISYKTDN